MSTGTEMVLQLVVGMSTMLILQYYIHRLQALLVHTAAGFGYMSTLLILECYIQ